MELDCTCSWNAGSGRRPNMAPATRAHCDVNARRDLPGWNREHPRVICEHAGPRRPRHAASVCSHLGPQGRQRRRRPDDHRCSNAVAPGGLQGLRFINPNFMAVLGCLQMAACDLPQLHAAHCHKINPAPYHGSPRSLITNRSADRCSSVQHPPLSAPASAGGASRRLAALPQKRQPPDGLLALVQAQQRQGAATGGQRSDKGR